MTYDELKKAADTLRNERHRPFEIRVSSLLPFMAQEEDGSFRDEYIHGFYLDNILFVSSACYEKLKGLDNFAQEL